MYIFRRKKCRRKRRLETDEKLEEYVKECLSKYWSPEIITEKWKEKYPNARLSHTTIYRALQKGQIDGYPGEKYLRRRNRLKYKKGDSSAVKPDRCISDRPKQADKRKRIGDWEGDTVHGARGTGCIVTCVDRKTRYLAAAKSQGYDALSVNAALSEALKGKRSITMTLDRGSEFSRFRELEKQLELSVYFADAHAPWQRGSNENINGLIRFFLPKGTDFSKLTPEHLDWIVELINTRPRKCLGWLSPKDIFSAKCCT